MEELNINNNVIPELEGLGLNDLCEEPDDVDDDVPGKEQATKEIAPISPLTEEELETKLPPIEIEFVNDDGAIIPERISLKIKTPEDLKSLPFFYKRVLFNLWPKQEDYPSTLPVKKQPVLSKHSYFS